MTRKKLGSLVFPLAVAALLTLSACAGGGETIAGSTWGDPDVKETPSITFDADGSLGGTDGCNVVGGNWTEDEGTITLDQLISTLMFCDGVDDWFTDSVSAEVTGDTMVFSDKDGEEIGSLERN
ncbi:MAG: META domain-containing protein [Leucobacter sp.]